MLYELIYPIYFIRYFSYSSLPSLPLSFLHPSMLYPAAIPFVRSHCEIHLQPIFQEPYTFHYLFVIQMISYPRFSFIG
jgi:hypothetical protein